MPEKGPGSPERGIPLAVAHRLRSVPSGHAARSYALACAVATAALPDRQKTVVGRCCGRHPVVFAGDDVQAAADEAVDATHIRARQRPGGRCTNSRIGPT